MTLSRRRVLEGLAGALTAPLLWSRAEAEVTPTEKQDLAAIRAILGAEEPD